jgi:hypothetical protein
VYPENTFASFVQAIRDGAEGIESDVHITLDSVVVMFHDPSLERTTDSKGLIKERNWFGEDGIQHVRTIKEPKQGIPTFVDTIALLMKVQNDPDRLFSLMHDAISCHPNWETAIAPRLVLGLWHPRFIAFAQTRLPYCRRSYIGISPYIARKYFWNDVEAFSIAFTALTTADGQRFMKECKQAGKQLLVWTVNQPDHMMEAVRWEVDVILTDCTKTWLDLRASLQSDYEKIGSQYGRLFLWTSLVFYKPVVLTFQYLNHMKLESIAGPFDLVPARIESADV